MAIYPYKCGQCGKTEEVVQSIASYSSSPRIPVCCGQNMERVITRPMVTFDMPNWDSFVSPIDGKTVIDSRSKRNEHMARHGVVPFQEVQSDFARNRKRVQQELDQGRKEAIVESIQMVEAGHKPNYIQPEELVPSNG